jgi:CheY-like chemotaxis protein
MGDAKPAQPKNEETFIMPKVLIIDDDSTLRRVLKGMLEEEGHEVTEAADGRSGLTILGAQPTDLVVTDIIMPEKEGWNDIVELRKKYPGVKILAISEGGKSQIKLNVMLTKNLGTHRVLKKPLKKKQLLDAVGELLGGQDASALSER